MKRFDNRVGRRKRLVFYAMQNRDVNRYLEKIPKMERDEMRVKIQRKIAESNESDPLLWVLLVKSKRHRDIIAKFEVYPVSGTTKGYIVLEHLDTQITHEYLLKEAIDQLRKICSENGYFTALMFPQEDSIFAKYCRDKKIEGDEIPTTV